MTGGIPMDIHTAVTLNNHIKIPQLGLGVY
jgi:hypothetical protein